MRKRNAGKMHFYWQKSCMRGMLYSESIDVIPDGSFRLVRLVNVASCG